MTSLELHAIWWESSLQVWGLPVETSGPPTNPGLAAPSEILSSDALRRSIGDAWEPLLVSDATDGSLLLRVPSPQVADTSPGLTGTTKRDVTTTGEVAVQNWRVPTLRFGPVDAVDLLTSSPSGALGTLVLSDSFRYWRRLASLVLELLARQRFIPTAYEGPDGQYYGLWRVLADDDDTAQRLHTLTTHMPPVCCAVSSEQGSVEAPLLVEDFLGSTVDALVRDCLEGDDLTLSILDRDGESSPKELWLRSLVSADPRFTGEPQTVQTAFELVRNWISAVEPGAAAPDVRLCVRLDELSTPSDQEKADKNVRWRIRLFAQTGGTGDVLPAEQLWDDTARSSTIPLASLVAVRERVLTELARAARHFEPLSQLSPDTGQTVCELSTSQAYAFLRDAAPVLEAEGIVVMLPEWWSQDRPRLQFILDVRPVEQDGAGGDSMVGLDSIVSYDWRVAMGESEITAAELAELASAQEPMIRLRGRWMEIRAADVERARKFADRTETGRMTLMECIRTCYFAEHSDSGIPIHGMHASGWIARLLEGAPEPIPEDAMTTPAEFHGRLRPYQLRGLRWLAFLSRLGLGGCLADDMGLGKTIQLITLWLHERQLYGSAGPTLLIVPMSLVGNWQREIERFAPSLRVMVHHGLERLTGQEFIQEVSAFDVVISTYGLAHRDFDHLGAVQWYRIALDEAQNIKNPMAKQSIAIRSLRGLRRVALTGTPVENRLSELWSIIDFLNPGYLGGAKEFRRRFAIPVERHHDPERTQQLRALIRPFVLRRLKSDPDIIKDLPEKLEMRVFCNLTSEQAALYQAAVDEMLARIERAEGIQRRGLILATLTKLKQVCNHPAHYLRDGAYDIERSGKSARLVEMLEEIIAEQDRALVFTQFREMGKLLDSMIHRHLGFRPYFLHGGTSQPERDRMTTEFQVNPDSPAVFVLSLKAGGYGLNLTSANHVFHYDRWWNPAVEDQASDRAHRIGQHRQVQVHKFVCIGTVEDRIDKVIEQKRSVANSILGGGEDWLTELSTGQLRDVFKLSRDAVAEG